MIIKLLVSEKDFALKYFFYVVINIFFIIFCLYVAYRHVQVPELEHDYVLKLKKFYTVQNALFLPVYTQTKRKLNANANI